MICIKPRAPRDDTACALPLLSTWITAQTNCTGTAKRRDASAMKAAYGTNLPRHVEGGAGACNSDWARQLDGNSTAAKAARNATTTRRDGRHARIASSAA